MNRKPSEIIQLGLNSGLYLERDRLKSQWFCGVLSTLLDERKILGHEYLETKKEISEALTTKFLFFFFPTNQVFLRSYLIKTGKIHRAVDYNTPEYRVAALEFWNALVIKLQKAGK